MRSERNMDSMRTAATARARICVVALFVALGCAAPVFAQDRTPFGAESAGNAAGTIPAWAGGLTQPVAGYRSGGPYPDPYPQDKPLFTISSANVEQYRKQLSAGQIALLQKDTTWQMNVYPTRRSAAFPQPVYAETAANAGAAKLAPGGNGVTGTNGGIPFPAPKDGLEAIWNTMLRYRGDSYATRWRQAAVTRGGAYTLVDFDYEFDFNYGNLNTPARDRSHNRLAYVLQTITGPANLAGRMLLVNEPVDHAAQRRSAWAYDPGERRVRPAPNVDYDNPGTASDSLRTSDDFELFNGATDRYEWKLVGRQELYIPYNSYRISGNEPTAADLLRPGHVNPDYARYELHRVWVVEATLKPGAKHIYGKRVFYIDEDSWMIAVTDIYDTGGELWRIAEQHSIICYDVPMLYGTVEVHTDLRSGRYLAMGLRTGVPRFFTSIRRNPADYTPAALRAMGTR
jgi:hypothetical protein